MLLLLINFILIWSLPLISSAYYDTFVSKDKRLLNDGNSIPVVGFGTATDNIQDLNNVPQAVIWAIEAGYRSIDTAALYVNEDLIGEAIKNVTSRGIVRRQDLFITTKLIITANTRKKVVPALEQALKRLQIDYVDMFLMHTPNNPLGIKKYDYLSIWMGMEDAKSLGLTKSIGVSNFNKEQMMDLLSYCVIKPAVMQTEVNPTYANVNLVDYCQRQGIIVMAYSPFGFTVPRSGVKNPPPPSLQDPALVKIAKKYGVATSQVALRYLIDRGTSPIPRSTNREHIRLNIDILRFSLTDEEVNTIQAFDINLKFAGGNEAGLNALFRTAFETNMRYANQKNKKLYPLQ